ncbi:MAG: acyl-CoA synthetase [Acidimicrobiales bacterium]
MSYNLAELFERVVDVIPDRTALITPARRLTYRGLDDRANQLAHRLRDLGVRAGDTVGLQLLNGTEFVEAMLAAFKLSAVPINVNVSYVERELEYLFDNADLTAVVFHRRFGTAVGEAADAIGSVEHLIAVDDGSGVDLPPGAIDFETAIASEATTRDWSGRSGDDLYIAYTGGTTGLPKGVMWRHEDVFFAALGGGDPLLDKGPITDPDQLGSRVQQHPMVQLFAPPLVHVSASWGVFNGLFGGSTVVLASPGGFDPAAIWALVEAHGVNMITVVGDAMMRPLLDHYAEHDDIDASSLFALASGGALLAAATKQQAAELLPNVIVVDVFGSSETGTAASRAGTAAESFSADVRTVVLDDDLHPVEPGSGIVGRLARCGHVPLGYYKDEAKTKEIFAELDGRRWVMPGDLATVEADGTIRLLGRGSGCINTGGEKVFPEEVEAVLKSHPDVLDVLVVGVPDDRWGSMVTAIVQTRSRRAMTVDELRAHARHDLAGYKLPKMVVPVDTIVRAPNGKPDYRWAGHVAAEAHEHAAAQSDVR